MTIGEILGPLEVERITILLSDQNVKIRGLKSSFFRFRIPLIPTSSARVIKCMFVKPLTSNSDKIIVGLLWNILFGKKFKVIHWFILLQVLFRTMKEDRQSRAILAILMIHTTQVGAIGWNSNMRPVLTVLSNKVEKDKAREIISEILKDLPFKLPKKEPKINELIKYEIRSFEQHKPKELARIGVGYKDKGSLSENRNTEAPESNHFELEKVDVFDVLLRQVQRKYPKILKQE